MDKKKIYYINTLFLGESCVGKTSIINRLLGNKFCEVVTPSVGCETHFFKKIQFRNKEDDNSEISIRIWDTAGQEKYRCVCKGNVQKADIIIFVRDNKNANLEEWFKFVEDLIDIKTKKIIYCLSKTDLMSEDEKFNIYNELEEINIQKKHNAIIQCVSSKNSDGILNLKSLIIKNSQDIVTNELERHIYKINIIFFGPSGVGKSSLIERIINNSFKYDTVPTLSIEKNNVKIDLKNHYSINYEYIDVCGQEGAFYSWSHLLDGVDIIIFINEKNRLEANISQIESRVILSDKKVICCINKKDLFSDAENNETSKNFKIINSSLKDKPLIIVSAKSSEGIENLKNQIMEYFLELIKEKKNAQIQNSGSTIERSNNSNFILETKIGNRTKKKESENETGCTRCC